MCRRNRQNLVPLILPFILLITSCSTQVTGMQAPVGHDYDGVRWTPLDGPVMQAIVVAPGYNAALDNDISTTPPELASSIQSLPDDVRNAEMTALRINVRQKEGMEGPSDARLQIFNAASLDGGNAVLPPDQPPVIDVLLTEAMDAEEWAVVEDPPNLGPASLMVFQLIPDSLVSERWEFALTTDRKPYGGWFARRPPYAENNQFGGAIAFESIFEQDPNVGSIVDDAGDDLTATLTEDTAFAAFYGLLLAATVAGTWILLRRSSGSD